MFAQMKQLMEMKKQAEKIKKELEALRLEVEAVPGIKWTIDGAQNFHGVSINEAIYQTQEKEEFERKLLKSVNAAIKKAQEMAARKMKENVNLNLPGF